MDDDYQKIYGGCQESLLFRTMLATTKQAIKYNPDRLHLEERWGDDSLDTIKKQGLHHELLRCVQLLTDIINEDYATQFGPHLSLIGKANVAFECAHILAFDFDQGRNLCEFRLPDEYVWHETGFAHAATAYRRECHWDFAPGEAGTWLGYYLISEGGGGGDDWNYYGNLVGFAVLYEREEQLAHIWAASAARRRGVATALLEHARQNFPLRTVSGPLTKQGRAFIERAWPEVLEK